MSPQFAICVILVPFAIAAADGEHLAVDAVGADWSKIGLFYESFAWPHKAKLVDLLRATVESPQFNLSAQCRDSLQLLATGLQDHVPWAIESKSLRALHCRF